MTHAEAIVFTGVGEVRLVAVDLPAPGPGQVLIKTAYSLISPGTELRCLSGKQPDSSPFPYIPGYAMTGTVIEAGEGTTLAVGSRVFCSGTNAASYPRQWGGHVSHAVQDEAKVLLLPDNVDFQAATLTTLAGIAYHGLRLSRPQAGELVAVLGLGVLGQLSARLHTLNGARVIGLDRVSTRVAILASAGIEGIVTADDTAAQFFRMTGRGADLVVDVTGVEAAMNTAIALAKTVPWNDEPLQGARILVQGSYAAPFAIDYQAAFQKELTFVVSRDNQMRDKRAVIDLLHAGKISVDGLISAVMLPADAAEAYRLLRDAPQQHLTIAFDWTAL